METQFDGVTVLLITIDATAYIKSPTLPGLTCTTHDLRQIYEMIRRQTSGTITLSNGTALQVIYAHDAVEFRQDGQRLVRITPEVKPGTHMNDLTGFYSALGHITEDDEDFELQPHYGFFLELDPPLTSPLPRVSVLNRHLRHIGTINQSDLPPFRRFIDSNAQALFLSNLLVRREQESVMLVPDNRPREVPAGHHQIINFEDPLDMTADAARHLIDTAEFLLEFESTPQTPD